MAQVWFRLAEERVSEVDERQSAGELMLFNAGNAQYRDARKSE
jgi:hypothetical protein